MRISRITRSVRVFGAWLWETARDVLWEIRHVWQVHGAHGSPHVEWVELADAEGLCEGATLGRVEILVRCPMGDGCCGTWFWQLQDAVTHEALDVSADEWQTANEAKNAALVYVMSGKLRGGGSAKRTNEAPPPPRFGEGIV